MSDSMLLLLFACASILSTDAVLVHRQLTPLDYPRAVCNNGQPANIYHTLGPPISRNFLVHLEGGFFCSSPETCEERCSGLNSYYCMPSVNVTYLEKGIFSNDPELNTAFSSFYKVFVHYCTSDMYIGQSEPTDQNGGYYFKGRAHVTAAVNALKSLVAIGDGDTLVVSGTSAGGRGVIFNCEYIASLLPGVYTKCLVDAAAFYPNWIQSPFGSGCKQFNNVMREANDFWNGTMGPFDVNSWWKTFPLPLFIGFQIFDVYAVMYFCMDPNNPEHLQTWADGMKEVALDLMETSPHVGLFLPGCFKHPMLEHDHWFHVMLAGQDEQRLTFTDAVRNWLTGAGPIHAWDDCTNDQHHCNNMCGAGPGSSLKPPPNV